MKRKLGDYSEKFLCIVLFLIILSTGYCFIFSKNEQTQIKYDKPNTFNSNWIFNNDKSISLPHNFSGKKDKIYSIKNTLPDYINDEYALSISSNYCYNEILVDGRVRYTYGSKQVLSFGRMVGNIKCIVPLTKTDAGKEIEIKIVPMYSQSYQIPIVKLAPENVIKHHILYNNIWKIVICTILLIFLLLCAVLGIQQYICKIDKGRRLLIYFSMFVLSALTWIICSSDLPQLFTNSNEAISFTSYLSLAFIGAPFMAFCANIFPTGKSHFEIMSIIGCVNTLLVIILFMTGIADPPQILLSSHIYFVFLVIADFFFSFHYKKQKTYFHKWMSISNFIILLFVALGLIMYYTNPTSGYDSICLSIGFTLFIIILFSMLVHMQIRMTKEITEVNVYKSLAYTDTMTKLGNRAAFDIEYEQLETGKYTDVNSATLFILDINNLKKTNDTLGHHAGDELIKGSAKCISTTFSSLGNVYRIGGDEFAVIILQKVQVEKLIQSFNNYVNYYNKTNNIDISIAVGYSQFSPDSLTPDMLRMYFQTADNLMYKNKSKMKENLL